MSPVLPARNAFHKRLPSDDDSQKNNPSGSSTELLAPARWKGKGKATSLDSGPSSDLGDHTESSEQDAESVITTYPPTNEDNTETKRIEENLKRWEEAERQKRRVQRESKMLSTTQRTSVVEGWSGLWSRATSNHDSTYNPHRPLRRGTLDGAVESVSEHQRPESPSTPRPNTPGLSSTPPIPEHSSLNAANPFSDDKEPSVSATRPSSVSSGSEIPMHSTSRPVLETEPYAPRATEQPRLIAPPRIVIPGEEEDPVQSGSRTQLEPASPRGPPPRWWTEWLCGCREDRTEQQGGATNPFE